MAQVNQLGGVHLLDLPCHNYGGSDLAEGVAVILDTSNPGTATTLVGVTLPASDAKAFGILPAKIPAGKDGYVRVEGVAVGTASGTIHVGDTLMTDNAGAVKPQTAGLYQIGIALSEAVSTDRVQVLVERGKNA